MSANHALFFVWDAPREGSESKAMEAFETMKSFWNRCKEKGEIDNFEIVNLASTRNANMPVGFNLVTGDRKKLQALRWENEEFLNLHLMTMMAFHGYACIDGYVGESLEALFKRFSKMM